MTYILLNKGLLVHCGWVTLYGDMILVNIGSGNGLVPDGTKLLPELMLTSHQTFCGIHLRAILPVVLLNFIRTMCSKISLLKLPLYLPGANELMNCS